MPRPPKIRPDLMRALVAYMLSGGYRHKEIAHRLRISPSYVSKLAAEVAERGWLRSVHNLSSRQIDEVTGHLHRAGVVGKIAEQLGAASPIPVEVHLCDSGTSFGPSAAVHLHRLLKSGANIVGVAYGSTLGATVDGLLSLGRKLPERLAFLPLRGDALIANPSYTPSAIAHRLAQAQPKQDAGRQYALSGVPPVVPSVFRTPSQRKAFDAYVELVGDYERIFVGRRDARPLIKSVDAIVTSVGPSIAVSEYTGRLYDLAEFRPTGLGTEACALVGDLAGIPILRSGDHSKEVQQQVRAFEDRLLGVKREDFRRVAAHGIVCVLASGDVARVPCLIELARQGLMTHLLVDSPIAAELRDRL